MTVQRATLTFVSDSCPAEILNKLGGEDSEHTLVTIMTTQDKIDRIRAHMRKFERNFNFLKWSPPNKSRPRKMSYRALVRTEMLKVIEAEFNSIFAWSYCGSTIRFLLPRLLQEFGISPLDYVPYTDRYGNVRVRNAWYESQFPHLQPLHEREVLAIMMIADGIASSYRQFNEAIKIHRPNDPVYVWNIATDYISGDSEKDKRRAELLQNLLIKRYGDLITVSYWIPGSRDAEGELLADNLAGCLQEALENPESKEAQTTWANAPKDGLIWHRLDFLFNAIRMANPSTKTPSAAISEGGGR